MGSVSDLSDFLSEFNLRLKGEDPIDIKQKCLTLCQKFLGANWNQLTVNDITVVRLTGGMSNQVYYCKILDLMVRDSSQIKEVAIRVYGTNHTSKTMALESKGMDESIIGLVLSENGMGPKVYGIFPGGQIQKYYPHKHLAEIDFYNKDLLNQLSAKLARFHAMTVPVSKDKMIIKDLLIECSLVAKRSLADKENLVKMYNCKTLMEIDFKKELDWIISNMHGFGSPIVFAHNDFRFGNLMVTDGQQIILGDFEASGSFHRGLDFATIFGSFDLMKEERVEYKDESIVKEFINGYLRENEKMFGKQYSDKVCNSVENILRETKVFSLVCSMVYSSLMIFNKELMQFPMSEQTCLTVADCELAKYLNKKKALSEKNIL